MAYNLGGVNPYSSGAVPINNDRYMDYFIKQQQHQQALKQAYQKNLAEQSSKLTPTGVDTKEVPDDNGVVHSDIQDFNNAKNQWLQHSMSNAKILANSNNPNFQKAYLDNQQLYNKTLDILDKSKQKVQNLPKYAALAQKNTGVDMSEDYNNASLPLSHPKHQDFDVSKVLTPQPFDVIADQKNTRLLPQFKESSKGFEYGNTDMNQFLADGKTPNPNFLKQTVKQNFGHTPEQIQGIANLGAAEYNTNPKLRNFIDNKLSQQVAASPDLFKHYDDVLFKHTGKHMDLDPTHLQGTNGHRDLAMAFKLDNSVLPDRVQEEKPEINKVAKDEFDRKANLQKQKDYRDYEVKHPIPTSAGTDTYDYLDKATKLLKTGNSDLINAHLAQWKAGAKTDPNGKKIGFDNAEPMSDGKIAIHYTIPFHIEHVGNVAREQTDILDPNDPQILPKMAALHQQFLGRDAKVEKALQKKPDNPAPSAPKPTGNQHQFLKQRGDGITINRKVKNDNWSISKTIQGASHDDGGVADDIQGKPINVEGGELKITNGDGHDAIIPKKWVQRVKSFLKIGDNKAVTKIVESLPKDPSIAEDGGD